MKKIFTLIFAMTMICGTALANGYIIVGLDAELPDFQEANHVNSRAYASYNGLFMDDAFALFAEASFLMTDFRDLQTGMSMEVGLSYNLSFTNDNYMIFILNSYTEMPFDSNGSVYSGLTPKVLFGHRTRVVGFVYLQVDVPFTLVDEGVNAFDEVGLDFSLKFFRRRGKETGYPDGFGFKTKLQTKLNGEDHFFHNLRFVPYFARNIFYSEIEVNIPIFENGMDERGVSIIPEIDIGIPIFDKLSLWMNLPISWIGAGNGNNIKAGLGMGVKFSF